MDIEPVHPQPVKHARAPGPRKLHPRLVERVSRLLHLVVEPHPLEALVQEPQRGAFLEDAGFVEPAERGIGGLDERCRSRPGAGEQVGKRPVERVVFLDIGFLGAGGENGKRIEAIGELRVGDRVLAEIAAGVEHVEQPVPRRLRALLGFAKCGAQLGRGGECRAGGEGGGDVPAAVIGFVVIVPAVVVIEAAEAVEFAFRLVGAVIALPRFQPCRFPQGLIARAAQFGKAGDVLVRIDRAQHIGIGLADRARVAGRVDPETAPGKGAAGHGAKITKGIVRRSGRAAGSALRARRR